MPKPCPDRETLASRPAERSKSIAGAPVNRIDSRFSARLFAPPIPAEPPTLPSISLIAQIIIDVIKFDDMPITIEFCRCQTLNPTIHI